MPVSIKDIARIARVSHSTVSRALQNPGAVNRDTAERIRTLARGLGYRPNAVGRSLATRRTRTLGCVVTTVADPFVAEVVAGIEEVAQREGYAVHLANSSADPDREIAAVRSFEERRVDGVLVMASRVGALYRPLLDELGVPLVLIDNQHPGEFGRSISNDDRGGARLAVRHLIELGHRRIAYIGDRHGLQSDADRLAGWRDELAAARIEPAGELIAHGDGKPEGGLHAMAGLLALRARPTAVFCYNDMTAMGALRALHAHRVELPRRMSVAGFDDLPLAQYLEPPLTTVRQPRIEMGRRAAAMLLDALRGGAPEERIVAPPALVVRESTVRRSR
ncbi:MAG: LacI family DNA-binding transcriptional regulator [Variibacter sp.]|nr:LacI family DNA-binding transcriptional regulator [Variibacter sp.]